MRKRVLAKSLLASALLLVPAACGGDDDDSSAAATVTEETESAEPADTTVAPADTSASAPATTAAGSESSTADSATAPETTPATTAAPELDLPDEIHIGVPLDMSGVAGIAAVGVSEREGMELAVKEINESGYLGDSKIVLDVVDTEGDKQKAVEAVLQFISDEVAAVVGFTITPSWLAAVPELMNAGIPAMSVELSAAGVAEVGEFAFRVYPDMGTIIPPADVEFAEAYGASTIAYLYQSDAASTAEIHAARKAALEAAGFETVAEQTFSGTDTDVRAQLTAIKDANPDLLVVTPLPGVMTIVYLQAAEVGIESQIIGAPDPNAAILEQAGPEMQCLLYTTPWNRLSEDGNNQHFLEYWEANGNGNPADLFHAYGYTSTWAMAAGIRAANSVEGEAIRDALNTMPDIATPVGDINFQANRTASITGTKVQIQDSTPVPWDGTTSCTK
jgi:branched-chain amino acid transport system substrate-binding protein